MGGRRGEGKPKPGQPGGFGPPLASRRGRAAGAPAAGRDCYVCKLSSFRPFVPCPPRLRQLRRDDRLFPLAMNVLRLDTEEDKRIAQHPALESDPDAELTQIKQGRDRWLAVAIIHVAQKHRCRPAQALQLLDELVEELKQTVPHTEIWAVPVAEVLDFPPELSARPCLNQPSPDQLT